MSNQNDLPEYLEDAVDGDIVVTADGVFDRSTFEAMRRQNARFLESMEELQAQNRAKDAVDKAKAFLFSGKPPEVVDSIERVAAAFGEIRFGDVTVESVIDLARQQFGVDLPVNWSGEVRVLGVALRDGQTIDAAQAGIQPQAFHLYGGKTNPPLGDAFAFLAVTSTLSQAQTLSDSLRLVDALRDPDDRDAKLLRLHEEALRREPTSTDEDVEISKTKGKNAEYVASETNSPTKRETVQERVEARYSELKAKQASQTTSRRMKL